MKMKICNPNLKTPGGCYETNVFYDEWYYVVDGDKIVRTNDGFVDPPDRQVVEKLPARAKILLSKTKVTSQIFELFLEDSSFVEVKCTPSTVITTDSIEGERQTIKWYDTIGAHLEFIGNRVLLGGTEVSIGKKSITGFHFPLEKGITIIGNDNYILSYTTPYKEKGVMKILEGEKAKPSELFLGIPNKIENLILKNNTLKIINLNRTIPFIASVTFTANGTLYRNVMFEDSIVDIFVPAMDEFSIIVDDVSEIPEEYIVDYVALPVVIDIEPESIHRIAGGFFVKVQGYNVFITEDKVTIQKGDFRKDLEVTGGLLSNLLDAQYLL